MPTKSVVGDFQANKKLFNRLKLSGEIKYSEWIGGKFDSKIVSVPIRRFPYDDVGV